MNPLASKTITAIFLANCDRFNQNQIVEHDDPNRIDSCEEIRGGQAADGWETLPNPRTDGHPLIGDGDVWRPAIRTMTSMFTSNPWDNHVSQAIEDHWTGPRENVAWLKGHAGTPKDHLHTFQYVPAKATAGEGGHYILAFEDHLSFDLGDHDYNDYVVELQFAAPIKGE